MEQELCHAILVSRLHEYLPFDFFEWNEEKITLEDIKKAQTARSFCCQAEPYSATFANKSNEWHIGRILYFLENPEAATPISIDCDCDGGNIYPLPLLLDGHHRYAAALVGNWPIIFATFGGRVDLLEYLCGESDCKPKD